VLLMDDDLIKRTLSVEGEVMSVAQSPRKRRYVIELDGAAGREVAWGKGREVEGYLTNPYEDELQVFGARFLDENAFVCFAERPDGRFELREGRFERARGLSLRAVGPSLREPLLAPAPCQRGQRVLLFKGVPGQGHLPVLRAVGDGADVAVGELTESPRASAASRDAQVVAWVDGAGAVWVSGEQLPMTRVGERDATLVACSHDGEQVAWCAGQELCVFSVSRRQRQRFPLPRAPLALGWRAEVV
jgi:hypothetical protein